MAKSVLMVSTQAKGGMLSVVKAYEQAGFMAQESVRLVITHDDGGMAVRLKLALMAYIRILCLLLTAKVSLVHLHVAERGSFFRKSLIVLLAKLCRVPVIMHMHAAEFRSFYDNSPTMVKRYISWILNKSDYVIVLSQSWRAYYAAICTTPIEVVANFVVDNFAVNSPHQKPPRDVLYMGKLGQRKGIYDLIQAVAALHKQFPPLQVWCAGDGEVEQVRAEVEQRGLQNSFHVLGWIDATQRQQLLEKCQIFVLPSYNEGLPMAIIEAMSARLAVVSTTAGGIPEMIESGKNGLLFEAGDIDALVKVLSSLLTNQDLYEQLASNARHTYESRYAATTVLARLSAIYRQFERTS